MRNEFKRSVAFLLPTDPVKNKKNRVSDQISYVSNPSTAGKGKGIEKWKWGKKASFKPVTGNTGVELRYYKYDEFSVLTQEQRDELQYHSNSNVNYKEIWSGKAMGSAKYNNGKVNYLTRSQVSSILKEYDDIKEKDSASKNEMVASMKEDLKGCISAYGTQMVPGYALGSAKRLDNVIILAVSNSVVDQNAIDAMAEIAAKSLLDIFLDGQKKWRLNASNCSSLVTVIYQ